LIEISNSKERSLNKKDLYAGYSNAYREKNRDILLVKNREWYQKNKPLEQEHFLPVTKNGGYYFGNIITACRSCNSSKQNKLFSEWYPSQSFYNIDRKNKILALVEQSELERIKRG